MPGTPVTFENAEGHTLRGILDRPLGDMRATALFAHCFTCSKDFKASNRIAKALTESGIAVLRFDFTGLGQSTGEFSDSSFSTNISDVIAAADWLHEELAGPDLLIGHSLGGTAILAAANGTRPTKSLSVGPTAFSQEQTLSGALVTSEIGLQTDAIKDQRHP